MKDSSLPIDQQRKNDHVQSALRQQGESRLNPFDDIRFLHHSLNQTDFERIDLRTRWAGTDHSLPFYINGMTGGSDFTKQYNEGLAIVARETGLAMASGSISAGLKHPEMQDTFTIIREMNPDGFVMANLGAHHSLENAQRAVDLLKADALQIHLNIPQEVVMPEGDRDFSMWAENIANIVEKLDVPVVVKEVGFGMSRETIELLIDLGVSTIDISGRGGTNFVRIENERRDRLDFTSLANWGQTSPEALLESLAYQSEADILASGGIRHPLDMVKALALGAKACGVSGYLLQSLQNDGIDATIDLVIQWKEQIQHLLLLLGCQKISDLQHASLIITGDLADWANLRKIDLTALANRK